MTRKLLLIIHINLFFLASYGQEGLAHIRGQSAVEAACGYKNDNLRLSTGYCFLMRSNLSYSISADYLTGKAGFTDFSYYQAGLDINYTIINLINRVFIDAGAGMLAGMEDIRSTVAEQEKISFSSALNLHLSCEIMFGQISVYCRPEQLVFIQGNALKKLFIPEIGIKYYLK
jgi:hypothetical protein